MIKMQTFPFNLARDVHTPVPRTKYRIIKGRAAITAMMIAKVTRYPIFLSGLHAVTTPHTPYF